MERDNILDLSSNKILIQKIKNLSYDKSLSWARNEISSCSEVALGNCTTLSNQGSDNKIGIKITVKGKLRERTLSM